MQSVLDGDHVTCSLEKARESGQEYQQPDAKRRTIRKGLSFTGGISDSLGPYGIVKETFLVVEESLRTLTTVRNCHPLE